MILRATLLGMVGIAGLGWLQLPERLVEQEAVEFNAVDTEEVRTLTAYIDGPNLAKPGVWCTYTVIPSGGTPPYTYQWLSELVPDGPATLQLRFTQIGARAIVVQVADSDDIYTVEHELIITSSAPPCS